METPTTQAKKLRLERTFDCTPERLWAAWTDPAQYARWLNPSPLDLVIHEWDLRPGGRMRFDMPQPDGNPHPQSGVFHELDPPRRLVTGEPDRSFLIEATFEPVGTRTRLVVEVTGLPAEWHQPATEGWGKGFDKLEALVTGRAGSIETRGITLERFFPAQPAEVWAMWTTPDLFRKWWGPSGHTVPACKIDLRVGGRIHYAAHKYEAWAVGVFREIDPERRLVMTDSFADAEGNVVEPTRYGMPEDFPSEMLIEVDFKPIDGGTIVTLRHVGLPSADGAREGWIESFDKLAAALEPAEETLRIERTFAAPVEAVWAAWTDPVQIARWWNPMPPGAGADAEVHEIDLHPGGRYALTMILPELLEKVGTDRFPVDGRVLLASPPRELRIRMRPDAEGGTFTTLEVRLAPDADGTRLALRVLGDPGEGYREGMAEGWNHCIDRLRKHVDAAAHA